MLIQMCEKEIKNRAIFLNLGTFIAKFKKKKKMIKILQSTLRYE